MIREGALKPPCLPGWILFFPLAAGMALYGALQGGAGSQSKSIVWFSVLLIVGGAILTRACRAQRQFDLFEPLYMVFGVFFVFYPMRALFAVWLDESWFDPAKAVTWKALWASAVGFVSFVAGYKVAYTRFVPRRRIWSDREWNLKRAEVVALVLLVLGIAGFVVMRFLGGSLFYFISLDPDLKSPGSISAWFYYLLWLCLLIQVGALIQLGSWLASRRRSLWTALYCILAILSGLLLARNFVVLFSIMLMVCWHYTGSKIRTRQVVVFSLLLVAYLGVAGLYREWISPNYNLEEMGGLTELAGQQKELALRYVVGNLEELSDLSDILTMTPSELSYQFGSTFTPVFLKPIPRVLMPTKPLGASALFARQIAPEAYDNGFATALGAWGEWYLNFSWPGLVFGMALTGAVTAAAYKVMLARNEFSSVLLYSSFLVVLLSWLRSDFNSATTYGLYYLIPIVLALAYITKARSARL